MSCRLLALSLNVTLVRQFHVKRKRPGKVGNPGSVANGGLQYLDFAPNTFALRVDN